MYLKETLMRHANPLVSALPALPALLTSFWVPTAVTANRIRWRRHYDKFSLRYEITKSRVRTNVTGSTSIMGHLPQTAVYSRLLSGK